MPLKKFMKIIKKMTYKKSITFECKASSKFAKKQIFILNIIYPNHIFDYCTVLKVCLSNMKKNYRGLYTVRKFLF